MRPFALERPTDAAGALRAMARNTAAQYIAGGTNIVDLMKLQLATPALLVDIGRLPLAGIEEVPDGGLAIGALASNADAAYDERVASRYPLLAQALLAGASAQLRNMATTGGNLLQRTRCPYFYDSAAACNKRAPGSGCDARGGWQRMNAILGASEHCIAVHPSDMCVALAALEAVVRIRTADGANARIAFADFHRLPGNEPERDSNLPEGALIEAVELPAASAAFAAHSAYLKLRDRRSYAFALVSVAAALELEADGSVRSARLALGGVAHMPWRRPEAEQALIGKPLSPESAAASAQALLEGAEPLEHNAFKLELVRRSVARALALAAQGSAR